MLHCGPRIGSAPQTSGFPRTSQPVLVVMSRVTVLAGPFRWIDALLDRRVKAGRVRILFELVHCSAALEIGEGFVKRAPGVGSTLRDQG